MCDDNTDLLLNKIDGIQLLRTREIELLRSVNRLLIFRRRNEYRKNIIDHVTTDSLSPYLVDHKPGSNGGTGVTLLESLRTIAATQLITKRGTRREFDEYKTSNTYKKSQKLKDPTAATEYVYVFDARRLNSVVKLLQGIDFVGGDRWFRSSLEIMAAVNYTKESFTTQDVLKGEGPGTNLYRLKDDERFHKLFSTEVVGIKYHYRITEDGFKMVQVWREITALIDKVQVEEVVV